MPRPDPHSWSTTDQPQADRINWRANVDFSARVLDCQVRLLLNAPAAQAGPLDLDTRDLTIHSVRDSAGRDLPFSLAQTDPIIGSRLTITLPAGATEVVIDYRTSPDASALQWLEPAQTAGGRHPFLYSQCEPIHARSIVPLQDTPHTRLRFTAELRIPAELSGLMAARHLGREVVGEEAIERFEMPQPISPYLLALAVGDLASRELTSRSRVWAEPSEVDAAAWEFADVDQMLSTGERLFGPYDWERYDVLVLPPSFPYGGMENPRLTFLTPTVVVGDRSATDVLAHEQAHSWTGNLISNVNAEHFWLNEGFTTYAERRIVEVVYGEDTAALAWALGRRDLDQVVARFERQGRSELSRLRTELAGIDPDIAYSIVPYEKGALFLWRLELELGRPEFDRFLRQYIDRFRFQAITTEQFVEFANAVVPGALEAMRAMEWLFQAGVPSNAPRPSSSQLEAIEGLAGAPPPDEIASKWRPIEWQIYLDALPHSTPVAQLADLDARFELTASRNYDVEEKWLTAAIRAQFPPALPRVEEILGSVGRMKYLRPLYQALVDRADTRALAQELFQRFEARYHPIARQVVRDVLAAA